MVRLRNRRFIDLKVGRQVPIGPFIVDFLIPDLRLIIEADGTGQGTQRDMDRDYWLSLKGFRILRLWNRDILTNLPAFLDPIATQTPRH